MATRRNRSGSKPIQAFSAGSYTTRNEASGQAEDPAIEEKIRLARKAGKMQKTADYFAGPTSNAANISDSNNIGYYSYEFPVDSLELPQSRAQELRYYRLAYDRDPIVGRGIDLHTEIPMSKITLERPKCSSEEFADYVYDFFQSLVTNSRMFETLLHASREYWTIGEAFLYIEDDPDVAPSLAAKRFVKGKDKDDERNAGTGLGGMESYNPSWGSEDLAVMSSLVPSKRSSINKFSKVAASLVNFTKLSLNTSEELAAEIKRVAAVVKKAKIVTRKLADEPGPADTPAADVPEAGDIPESSPSDLGDDGMGGDDFGGGAASPGGGGGLMPLPDPNSDFSMDGGEEGQMAVPEDKETRDMKKYLALLKKKKELLEELKMVRQTRANDIELFKHICNKDYTGFDRIQLLPPENVEIRKA